MTAQKGAGLEELVRAYFAMQGFFSLRGVKLRFEDEEVTDIDVWLYGRHSTSVRTRTLVDVKDKRSPKAFERILWTRGMQLALGCDRGIVATTESNPKVIRFAQQQRVSLLNKSFLERLGKGLNITNRLTGEQFIEMIQAYPDQKQDGDWVRRIADAKSAVVSLQGYPAFNKAMSAFRFFSERIETRFQHREQALRCAYFSAAIACIALDAALERTLYEDSASRYRAIVHGVTYGDSGDARTQNSINTVLELISTGMDNGRIIARQARDALDAMFQGIRADIIGEHFSREHNAAPLFNVAKELDERSHSLDSSNLKSLSIEAKTILGVFSDFVKVRRTALLNVNTQDASEAQKSKKDSKELEEILQEIVKDRQDKLL